MKNKMYTALGFHTISKMIVIMAGYALHFSLGKVLSRQEYGVIGTVIAFTNFYYMFLTNGVRQGISKALAMNQYNHFDVIKKGLFVQMFICFFLAGGNYFLAPVISTALGDSGFRIYIEMISLLIPLTAIYFAFTGGLNGLKLFFAEALVVCLYPIFRLSSILFAHFTPDKKILMIIIGFTLASLLSALLAATFLFTANKDATYNKKPFIDIKTILHVSFDFIFFFASITLVLNLDTFFLQYVQKDTGLTGLYTGVHTFSLVPYYLISSFYLVILPFITEHYAKGDIKGVKKVISQNFNTIFILVLPITALIAVTAPDLLASFYNQKYYLAGKALSILSLGTFFLSSYAVLNVILNGMDCKRISMIMSFFIVLFDIILLKLLIPLKGLEGAAMATTLSALTGCVAAVSYLVIKIGNPFDIKTMLKSMLLILFFAFLTKWLFVTFQFDNLIKLIGIYSLLGLAYIGCAIWIKIVSISKLQFLGRDKK